MRGFLIVYFIFMALTASVAAGVIIRNPALEGRVRWGLLILMLLVWPYLWIGPANFQLVRPERQRP